MIECPNEPTFDELEHMQGNAVPHYEHFGDPLEEHPSDTITRVYVQNLNGLCWDKDGGRWPYICEAMSSIQADIVCLSELNTNTNKYHVRAQMEQICRRQYNHSRLVMSSSSHKTIHDYKPGGTAILACNNITSHIKSHTRDRMGRWTSLCLSSTPTKSIRIISAYQVCAGLGKGSTTAAAQQQALLISEQCKSQDQSRLQPRQAFISDLQSFILQIQAANEEVLLVGDFNEELHESSSGMGILAARCGLTDIFAIRTGMSDVPATYQRGTKRLDYVLASPSLVPSIVAAGYDPFGYRIPSDHRGMYIDFATETLFQHQIPPLAPAARREFSSKTPGVVNAYVTAKMQYLQQHNFFSRLRNLLSHELPNHDLAEALDRDFQRAAVHAARKCSRKQRHPWSPHLAAIWATLHYYKLARSALNTQVSLLPAITKLQNKWNHLPRELPTDPRVIKAGYDDAIRQLKEARQNAQELREAHLSRKAEQYMSLDQKGKAKAVQRLIRAESQHKVYRKLQFLRSQEEGELGLNHIRVPKTVPVTDTDAIKSLPDSNTHWETITVPREIEQLLLQRNRHHFGQAKDTPFATPPLDMEVGYKADGYAVDLILQGTANYPTLPTAAQLVIAHLQRRSTTIIDGSIDPKQILGKLRKWKEDTTTSPSGLHLGHYHCLWRTPQPVEGDGSDSTETIKNHQATLLQALTDLLNYAIKHGYSYHRWSKIVNVMLQKDAGNPRIHRLRIIHIYEADYNLLLAVKWRQALLHAEANMLLNDGLYGSRKGRSAHDPVLIEVLQNEIYRTSMKSGINFDLDATSCYDRILMNVASLSSRRMGMHSSIILVNATNLEQARYHLKTNLGVSDSYYSHCSAYPIFGTGQGSGNSPTIWCFVCSALFDAFESQAQGATFTSYDGIIKVKIYMIGFVDDCTQRVNCFDQDDQPSTELLIQMMTREAQLWNDILWASGGALEQSKCSFHLIQSDWNEDGHPFLRGGVYSPPIRLIDGTKINSILQKSNYDSHRTLGCQVNPAYTNQRAHQVITSKNNKFAQLLETNYFSRQEAWIYYTSFYLPSITYPLPMTPLTIQQCVDLNSRVLRVLLPKCGYNRNMSTAIRYAPQHLGGAGFRHLYHEQGILLFQHAYKHLNSPSTTIGQLLRAALSWTQAFLGISKPFLTHLHLRLPPMGKSWLLDLREFLILINAPVHLTNFPVSRILRVHDRFIMDIALTQLQWKTRHLSQINSCRRYLQAQSLADISNANGTRLVHFAVTGQEKPPLHTIKVEKFNQKRPGERAWRTWRKFLGTISNAAGLLYQPLGPWLVKHDQVRHWPKYVYDPSSHVLYSHHSGPLYQTHDRVDGGSFCIVPSQVPTRATGYPTAVISVSDCLRPTPQFIPNDPPTPIYNPTTLTYHTPWEAQLLERVIHLVPLETIRQHVTIGNIIMCSDGSATPSRGTFGFVAATNQGQRLARGNGPAPGAQPNSFRSEAYGVLATMLWLRQMVRHVPSLELPLPKIIHYLDNKSVITRIENLRRSRYYSPNLQLQPEHDVISEIVYLLPQLPWHIDFQWVRGHQNDSVSEHHLTLPAQLNCEADREADKYTDPTIDIESTYPLPHTPCRLVLHDKVITSHHRSRLRTAAATPKLYQYMISKFQWQETTIQLIDWDNYTAIIKKYRDRRVTIVKHLFDISPTGKIAHRNDPTLSHQCPACESPYEDNAHVLRCSSRSRQQWRADTLSHLQRLDTTTCDPILMDILHDGVRRYFLSDEPPPVTQYPERYWPLIFDQTAIGWDQVFKARWSLQWHKLHTDYQRRQATIVTVDHSKATWLLKIGRCLVDRWIEVWDIRNAERHGKDVETQRQRRLSHITAQLVDLYQYKDKVCPAESHLFHSDVNTHLHQHKSLNQVEDWIAMYGDAIRDSATMATKMGLTRNRLITQYPTFNPAIQPGRQASLTAGLPAG